MLGSDPGLAALKTMLVERTDGNPLFLEESVRALVETQALIGEPGARRLAKPLETVQVPVSVQAVLAARIDRLTPAAKHVLQSASVIGKDVPFPVLAEIADLPDEGLRAGLALLQSGELLYEASFFPEIEYTFKHALTQEVAYGSLLHETRRALHARIVDTIERLYAGRLGEHVERLAHHALRGSLRERAVDYLRQAGAKAAARSAHREAVGFFEQALEILEADGPRGPGPGDAPSIWCSTCVPRSLRSASSPGRSITCAGRPRRPRRSATGGASAGCRRISPSRTTPWASRPRPSARPSARWRPAGRSGTTRCRSSPRSGSARPITCSATIAPRSSISASAVDAVDGALSRERWGMAGLVSVAARIWLAASLADTGDFDEALARAREGVALAETPEHPWSLAGAVMTLGFVHLSQGHLDEAGPVLDRGIVFSREMDLTAWLPMLLCARGVAHARSGRVEDGLVLLEEGVRRASALRILSRHALRLTWLAECYLIAGRVDAAAELADQAQRLATEHAEQGYAALAARMAGEVAARAGQGTRAAERYTDALARARALQMRPLEALCHLGLGELARGAGDGAAAKEQLTVAVGLLREMDMRYWLAQAEAALGAV